jgi:predicted NUDIX family phosphoesterase
VIQYRTGQQKSAPRRRTPDILESSFAESQNPTIVLQGGPVATDVLTEHVLVVPTELFHQLGYFQGFSSDTDRYLGKLLSPSNTSYRPRSEMENDTSFKQLIPYVIFTARAADGQLLVFQYTRGKGQGESRLHSKRSAGVGGHISVDDRISDDAVPYTEGMRRELQEEVAIDCQYTERCVGLINDDQTPVGQVHLGIVHLVELEEPSIQPRETDLLDSGFLPIEALLTDLSRFETWSQYCLQALFGS